MKNRKLKLTLIFTFAFLLVVCGGCGIYLQDYYRASEDAYSSLESDGAVTVEDLDGDGHLENGAIAFVPEDPTTGFIFYPGGKVEHTAYAPLLRSLAEEGILCVVVEMPFRLAVLDVNAADGIQDMFPQVENWYIGGHSLGGSMAASYAAAHEDMYAGLVLLAAYSTEDLSDSDLQVLSIYGTEDKVLNMEKYEEYYHNLPNSTKEFVVEGGCHAYFGSYGEQKGDGLPSITVEEQTEITTGQLVSFFE